MSAREKYWLKVWNDKHVFEPDPVAAKKKIFVTVPFPYMNAPVHVGTAFTAARVEFYARFRRLQGYNVLFPWAWHWTGKTIVGMSQRLKQGDKSVRRAFVEVDGVPEKEVEKFVDPEYLASYYTKVSRQVMKDTGFSIDWRREFRTVDPAFRRFVEWQYLRLRELGYVVQGTHPVVWCPFDKSPTGDHDRMEGEGVSPEEFNLIKFHLGEWALVAATLRPETIYGATNVWVNPDAEYSEARVDGELWVVSSASLTRLAEQKHNVVPVRSFKGSELVGRYAMAPLTGKSLPILPGKFVDDSLATGVVYSVPAHAPYDLMALRDIQEGRVQVQRQVKEIADKIVPIPILSLKGYSQIPAKDAVDRLGIRDSLDQRLEAATGEVYSAEFHHGVLTQASGPLAGLTVGEAKTKSVELLAKTERLNKMFELPGKVVCRCGTRCYVKILENQWFLNYSDPAWKAKARLVLERAAVYPEDARQWFYSTIEWLNDWPCARHSGMGTKLPWDKDWIVETLSDSTIYMAYYNISKFVNLEKIGPESLTPEAFDYIFYGKGNPANIAKAVRTTEKRLKEIREEFAYWYPVDLRNSAKELIPNHLTFFAFHHAALFPEKQWPKGFGVNGMIQIEGKKMSKTKGNFVTWRRALDEYGADGFRLGLALTADGMDDADWRGQGAEDAKGKVESAIPFVKKTLKGASNRAPNVIDAWLISSIHRKIVTATEAMEQMKIRRASSTIFLDFWNDVRYYLHRTDDPRKQTLVEAFNAWVRMMSPFTPFMAEDLNHELGGKGLVCQADWPSARDFPLDEKAELAEAVMNRVIDDARNVLKVVKGPRSKLNVYVCSDAAKSYFFELATAKKRNENVGKVVKKYASLKIGPDRVFKLAFEIGDEMMAKLLSHKEADEYTTLTDASEFMSNELGIKVVVQKAGAKDIRDPANKAKDALPTKPGFYLE
ncbi:MAG: leucine--tRNA ligase [Nitrososphaerota archaeon]|nr:leucine--tRNA ligase [Nitrososphaerota archaeon]MDG7024056.1 leucine--tRNA ligase [Nitrososphaerota archaeon]